MCNSLFRIIFIGDYFWDRYSIKLQRYIVYLREKKSLSGLIQKTLRWFNQIDYFDLAGSKLILALHKSRLTYEPSLII